MWKYRHFSTCEYLMTMAAYRAGLVQKYLLEIVVIGTHYLPINNSLATEPSGFDPACRMLISRIQVEASQYVIGTLVIHHRCHDPQFLVVDLCLFPGELERNDFEPLLGF